MSATTTASWPKLSGTSPSAGSARLTNCPATCRWGSAAARVKEDLRRNVGEAITCSIGSRRKVRRGHYSARRRAGDGERSERDAAVSLDKSSGTRRPTESTNSFPPIICSRCGGPIVAGQLIGPLFSPKLVKWAAHPVLSKPPMLRGIISVNGSPGRSDLSLGDQLRQRAAMGGEKERAELAAFENLLAKSIADALVAQLRDEAAAHGVDVWTWLSRQDKDRAQ